MKTFLTLFFLVLFTGGFAQKSKLVEIYRDPWYGAILYAGYFYDENNNLISTAIYLNGPDSRYPHIGVSVYAFLGTPQDFFTFMNEVEEFVRENKPGFLKIIQDHPVSIDNPRQFSIYELKNKGNGCMYFNRKTLEKIKNKFIEYARANNIQFTGL